MKPAGYANFDIVFAHGKMVGIFGKGFSSERSCPLSPNLAAHLSTRRTPFRGRPRNDEILTMPGVAIGGGNPFLDPGAYRVPMIFQLA
jgi:hypothetical protein